MNKLEPLCTNLAKKPQSPTYSGHWGGTTTGPDENGYYTISNSGTHGVKEVSGLRAGYVCVFLGTMTPNEKGACIWGVEGTRILKNDIERGILIAETTATTGNFVHALQLSQGASATLRHLAIYMLDEYRKLTDWISGGGVLLEPYFDGSTKRR